MKTNKIALSLATAGLLVATSVTNAAAEESGWFLGVKGDIQNLSNYTKISRDGGGNNDGSNRTSTTTSQQIGILGGYKKFFSPKLGVRFYGVLDYGRIDRDYDIGVNNTENSFGFGANVEALFNFVETESWGLGAFAGGGLGYVGSWYDYPSSWANYTRTKHGFDMGVNVGLRVNFGRRHGLEILNRLGFTTSRHKYDYETLPTRTIYSGTTTTQTYIPYSDYSTNSFHQRIELRYVFSF